MSAEVVLSVIAVVVSVLSALWTAYSTWQHDRAEKHTAAARAEEFLHTMYCKETQKAMAFISIYARVPGTPDFNQSLADFMKNPQRVSKISMIIVAINAWRPFVLSFCGQVSISQE